MSSSRFARYMSVLRVLCVCAMAGQSEADRVCGRDGRDIPFYRPYRVLTDMRAHLLKTLGCADEAGLAELVTL